MELLVVEEAFAIAVVVLEEQVLVVAAEEAVVEFDDGVVVERPAFAFHEGDGGAEATVGGEVGGAYLIYAAVVEDVFVFGAVNDGYPEFAVNDEVGIDHDTASETYFVPRA